MALHPVDQRSPDPNHPQHPGKTGEQQENHPLSLPDGPPETRHTYGHGAA